MKTSDQDISFVSQALPQMQDYLLSNELYWPLSGSLPRLTPGSLLLTILRLRVYQPSEAQKAGIQLDVLRTKWHTAWEKKVGRELANRMRLWSQFLSDFTNSPEQNADSYPSEARGRAILQLLLAELPEPPEMAPLAQLDSILKAHLIPSGFIWDAPLQAAFPASDFWFLYGKL